MNNIFEATNKPSSFSDSSFLQWNQDDIQVDLPHESDSLSAGQELVRGGLTQEHLESISSRQWKSVLSWAVFHPNEVSVFVDQEGHTALHHACLFRAPASVVEALIYAAPMLASTANEDDELPLHWAVRLAAPKEVLKLLLNAYPESVFAIDRNGETPMDLLFSRHKNSLNETFRNWGPQKVKSSIPWEQMTLFVRSYNNCESTSASDGIKFRPQHAFAACPCAPSVFRFVLDVCMDSIKERDEFGQHPLSIAAASRRTTGINGKSKIEELLRRYPEAAGIPDASGRLPLNLAIISGKTWEGGVKILLEAEPRALSSRDCASKLYPFMLASSKLCGKNPLGENDLNTIFSLLREDPSLVTPFPLRIM